MQKVMMVLGTVLGITLACPVARAHEPSHAIPAGPIRERHELMEGIGKNAKIIGDALKAGNETPVAAAAEKIQASAAKIPGLFPQGSTDPKSRAKPEIWTNWAKFEESAKKLQV